MLDVPYMESVLQLKHVDQAYQWIEAYHDDETRKKPCSPFPPLGEPFVVDTTTDPESYKVSTLH